MNKTLAVLAVVGGLMFCVSVMITSAAKKAADMDPPTCGAPVETSLSLYIVEKYGDGFWRAMTIAGGVLIGLSVVLFCLCFWLERKNRLCEKNTKENCDKNE